ncbi:serine/threonine-protein kinase [Microbacterium hydrocarbonoxydans]|uniref:serine/threonine-protein kinase n=1 Tax=Microbacterium hydrocarbonoxydans TaxID=273678 RepID=UPI00203A737F|nr:serine/threonine-protein kinase [Microbacterium hydrocarbonoxydans]MCM3778449.1 serine/threonine protein kinase [Microbacterium hydrocarbonoxydans]
MSLEVMSPTEALLDGRYVLKERVGRGGMATVYRAEDTHLERTVAIKMIHEDDDASSSAERAHNEKALLAAVDHRALVTLYDAQLIPGRPRYLVMEFVEGPTLARRMSTGPMRPRQVARVARDVAEALSIVHGAGIVHRDVKPSNVLLARDPGGGPWTAKLADFGIACTVGSPRLTSPGIVLGTLTYMAPEQLRDAEPGTAVDVFSLGLLLIEALTGVPAYPAMSTGRGAAVARLMNPPTIPDDVPDEWRGLLDRMTRLEPSERPTAREVARAARALMRGEAPTAVVPAGAAGIASGADAAEADAVSASAGAGAAAAAPAEPPTDRTAVLDSAAPRRRRNPRAIAGIAAAAAVVVAGGLVTGFVAGNPPVAEGGRLAASFAERTVIAPEDSGEAPVEVVVSEPTEPEPVVNQPAVDRPAQNENKGPGNNNGNENKGPGNNNGGKGDEGDDD